MLINNLLIKHNMTKNALASKANIPYTVVNDICNGKLKLGECSDEVVCRISNILNVSMELLIEDEAQTAERERLYEYRLPDYLQHDLDAYKEGLKNKSSLLDCLWGELYGSINIAEINDGAITSEHANYLRQKYL